MKHILAFLIFIFSLNSFSQELNDFIYTKDSDSIKCKITTVEKNWIYYDFKGEKSTKHDFIHMSDIKYYIQNGVKRKSYEYETDPNINKSKNNADTTKKINAPKDTLKTTYLDNLGKKQSCSILLYKAKTLRAMYLLKKIEIIDSIGKLNTLYPNQIQGYWLEGKFYKSFSTFYNNNQLDFFALELLSGSASLYLYDGDLFSNKSIYLFKKESEKDYSIIQERISITTEHGRPSTGIPEANGRSSGTGPIIFFNETPYLQFFQNYFSDCNEVLLRFKANWYSYTNVTNMFQDYNNCKK